MTLPTNTRLKILADELEKVGYTVTQWDLAIPKILYGSRRYEKSNELGMHDFLNSDPPESNVVARLQLDAVRRSIAHAKREGYEQGKQDMERKHADATPPVPIDWMKENVALKYEVSVLKDTAEATAKTLAWLRKDNERLKEVVAAREQTISVLRDALAQRDTLHTDEVQA